MTSPKRHVKKKYKKKKNSVQLLTPTFLRVSVSRAWTAYRNVTLFGLELTNHICTAAQEDPSSLFPKDGKLYASCLSSFLAPSSFHF